LTDESITVVLTALNLEYEAVLKLLSDNEVHLLPTGTRFEIGTVQGTTCRIALGLTGVGNQSSAVLAERAMQEFSPTAVLFVGVAGALWDSPGLGDVVVASRVYAYHGGTSEDGGLDSRPRAWETPHGVLQLAQHLARSGDWTGRLPSGSGSPKVCFGAIAAGEIVQNSRVSREARWIRSRYNDAIAIEMEAAGVAQAAHLNGAAVAIVRGISDRADGTKNSEGDIQWQPRAAANAAAFAIRIAEALDDERAQTAMTSGRSQNGSPGSPETVTTTVGSGAMVGIIAVGPVTRSPVTFNAAPAVGTALGDLVAAMADLRRELDRDRENGEVDDDTYEAAQEDLEEAATALRGTDPESRRKSRTALKRLRGLVEGTTNTAVKLAPVIEAVNGLR
jgi:adenosylhomocysteine nucleosidase